jgi:branched-chain amino acid transport system ATP-binding protein
LGNATVALLELRCVQASFGDLRVLRGVTLEVERGEIVCLIGANGAGKTTLLRSVSRLVRDVTGTLTFDDSDLLPLPAHRVPALGIAHVPEGRRVFPEMTVAENLRVGAFANERRTERAGQLERVLALFPVLRDHLRQLAGTLSGGEQQMLVMGRAMMSGPRLLLLDEPSLGLAPIMVEAVFELINQLHQAGTAILLVEQNAYLALEVASRSYVLESGEIRLSGPSRLVAASPDVQNLYLGG